MLFFLMCQMFEGGEGDGGATASKGFVLAGFWLFGSGLVLL
jgi:hypothetical protein